MIHRGSLTGAVLVATPELSDFFDHAVVLVLHHDDDGAQGVVLNKPMDAQVDAVLPQWHAHVTAPPQLYQGGPVGLDSAIGLVRMPEGRPAESMVGVNVLSEGVGLVDLDAPVEVVMPQVNAMRVYVGYAGWTAGQLVGEIDEGAWQVVDADPDDPFWPDTSQMWRAVLARQRNPVSWLTTYTAHPDHN